MNYSFREFACKRFGIIDKFLIDIIQCTINDQISSFDQFLDCNLNMATMSKTSLINIQFKDCKMLGISFEHCNPFGLSVSFDNCILTHSSFYKLRLAKTVFKNSNLQHLDFSECDL